MKTYELPANCNREAALTLFAFLKENSDQDVTIDASAVETIGQQMLQTLLAARAGITIAKPSKSLREVAELVAVESLLLKENVA